MAAILALGALFFAIATLRILMVTPPARLARALRRIAAIATIAVGALLTLTGRGALGFPLILAGAAMLRRYWRREPVRPDGPTPRSSVRALWLEMVLDHDSGDLEGTVLAGRFASRPLSSLDPSELGDLRAELSGDPESLRLLETYLDRRVPGWRADAKAEMGDGLGGAPGSGPMTEQEAYQILGLQPGATLAEIREAHRRLMKRMHPDRGGSDFLAARINEAKAFLIERHR